MKSGTAYTTNYALKKSQEDILIFGASEVTHSLISDQISDNLQMSCYNLGMDGQNIYYHYVILTELLKRHKPKIVITSTFILQEDDMTTIAPLFPYYFDYQSVRDMVDEIEPNEKYKLLIKSYAYNSLLINVIQGYLSNEPNTNGYKPLFNVSKDMKLDATPFKINFSDKTLNYFEKFIQTCLNADCKVIVIDTPRYVEKIDLSENLKIRELLEKYSVNYLNFATDTTFLHHQDLFKDRTHLNNEGAIVFTKLIIKALMNNNSN